MPVGALPAQIISRSELSYDLPGFRYGLHASASAAEVVATEQKQNDNPAAIVVVATSAAAEEGSSSTTSAAGKKQDNPDNRTASIFRCASTVCCS